MSDYYKEIQLIISIVTICMSGMAAYFGIKIAITKIESDNKNQEQQNREFHERLNRLEKPFFDSKE